MASLDKKPFIPSDFLKFEFVSDPQISPDASRVAFVRTVVDAKSNKYRSAIMVAPTVSAAAGAPASAGSALPFTSGLTPDSSPRWSPDGCYLAFLSGRDPGVGDEEAKKKPAPQIWIAPTGGGEARPITALKGGVLDFIWASDSRTLAFTTLCKAEGPEYLDDPAKKDAPKPAATEAPKEAPKEAAKDARKEAKKDAGGSDLVFPAGPEAESLGEAGFSDKAESLSEAGFSDKADTETAAKDSGSGEAAGATSDREGEELEALFKKHNEDVKHITRIFYRLDGVGYLDDRRCQVFVIDVEAALLGLPEKGPAVRPIQVTTGDFDHDSPAFSPDGRFIAVGACRDKDADLQRYRDIYVFEVPPMGGAGGTGGGPAAGPEPRRLTAKTGFFHTPAWSPDGKQIAFLGHEREYSWYTDDKVWLCDVETAGSGKSKPRCLTKSFGRSFGDQSIADMRVETSARRPVWTPDGKHLFLLASDQGTTHLHAVEVATGKVSQLTTGDWVIFGWSADAECRSFAFALARPDSPNDIYVGRLPESVGPAKWPTAPTGLADLDVIARQPVTKTNAQLLKSHIVSRPERFSFSAPGGPSIDGWAIRPAGYQEGKKYPAVLEIHGGPMTMYTGTFFFEFQLLASRGIGVIFCNPRGSQGYGEEFCAGIKEEWGKNDYADIMACVDEACKTLPWIDQNRLGVAGGSYGGYMTSWIIGHTDRFKAACSMRAVNNCHSFFGTSDTGYTWDDLWHGTPWKNPEALIKGSPITYAGNVKTPTLITHSEDDHRCLIEQGEQFFVALKTLGVEAEFIRYPGESHGLSRGGQPWHRVHRLKSIVEWFEKRLKG